jgi:hypothetical protein
MFSESHIGTAAFTHVHVGTAALGHLSERSLVIFDGNQHALTGAPK